MKNNNAKEDNYVDRSSSSDSNRTEAVNTLVRENAKTINISNAKDNEKSQKVNWWINELDSLGIKQEEESNKGRVRRSDRQYKTKVHL
jgi:hypothetical protein